MFRATRWTAFFIAFLCLFLWSHSVVLASPSAYECLENPNLEGCPSSETTGDSDGSPAQGMGEETDRSGTSLGWNIVKLIVVLLFILALIYGLLKFFNQKNKLFNRNRTMENLGGMNLAPNRSIQAVRIGEQVFILGVGESVDMITEVTDEATKKALVQQDDQQGMNRTFGVDQWLGKWKKSGNQSKKTTTSSTAVQFQQLFENQLNDMKQKRNQMTKKEREDRHHE